MIPCTGELSKWRPWEERGREVVADLGGAGTGATSSNSKVTQTLGQRAVRPVRRLPNGTGKKVPLSPMRKVWRGGAKLQRFPRLSGWAGDDLGVRWSCAFAVGAGEGKVKSRGGFKARIGERAAKGTARCTAPAPPGNQ